MEIVNKSNAHPDKDYGQNFLIDPEISKKIVDALEVQDNERILEIGPGLGSLTHFLQEFDNVTVCDIDKRMIDFLKIIYENKITYILDDVRKIDVSHYDKIIANLPYNITSELVTFLLSESNAKKMVLMCQQEAFNHFYDVSGKEYGPISVLLHLLGDVKKLFALKPGYFYPAPKCNSLVFSFDYNPVTNKEDILKTFKLSKALFLNRRKTIYNNLKSYLGGNKEKTEYVLETLKIDLNKRPEDLSPETFLNIYKLLYI